MEIILKYFPQLTQEQQEKFSALGPLYRYWNEKINLISRKDMDGLYEKHILHSLSIARIIRFAPGSRILDVGTGGGFPGIPLAIYFPETEFHLVDSIGKKIIEEAGEVWIAAEHESNEALADEISQLIYHLQTLMLSRGLKPDDIYKYL